MSIQLKPIIAALGLGLATLSGSAAAVTLYDPITNFQDNDVDFVINGVENDPNLLDPGDTLISIFEIDNTNNPLTADTATIAPQELTGVAAITFVGYQDIDGIGGVNDMVFSPYAGGLNSFLGGNTVAGGGAGGGAMTALYLDGTPNLETQGSTNCTSLNDCIARATDGTLYLVAGFVGDTDEFWIALNAEDDTALVLASPSTTKLGAINYGLSILDDGGNPFVADGLTCTGATALFCAGDDKIDIVGSGDVLGGQGLVGGTVADGAFAHSDFDFQVSVPEPTSIALLGIGLLGMGASLRRRMC